MEIRKILFVTDFEELWLDALKSLMDLRKAGLDHVVLMNVLERKIGYYTEEEKNKLMEMAEVRFVDWAQSLFEEGMECGTYVVEGNAVAKIMEVSKEEDVDLIVISRQKRTKLETFYLDSKSTELLRKTTKPVLVHKFRGELGEINNKLFEVPLLALDWSSPANRALEFLVGLKNIIKKLQIIQVITEKAMAGLGKRGLMTMERDNRKKLRELCNTLEGQGIEAKHHLYMGDLIQIDNAAREHEATLIVTGTTKKSAWQARWLGSISHQLAEVSELPTLLVP